MKIAVVGCTHGELDAVYQYCRAGSLRSHGPGSVDLIICCGDFQAARNEVDLDSMESPKKYHLMKDFHQYYSTHLWELPFGGWAAPNIYYLGFSGVVQFGGYRIAGVSGIKGSSYGSGHFERPPFDEGTQKKSFYAYRSYEFWKLGLLKPNAIDIMCSHEWPLGIGAYPGWTFGAPHDTVGFDGLMDLMMNLQPTYWMAGHMHHKMSINIPHPNGGETQFRAFSKPGFGIDRAVGFFDLPDRPAPRQFSYDPEWLAVLKATFEPLAFTPANKLGIMRHCTAKNVEDQLSFVNSKFNDILIPASDFVRTAPIHGDPTVAQFVPMMDFSYNPQTESLLTRLDLPKFWLPPVAGRGGGGRGGGGGGRGGGRGGDGGGRGDRNGRIQAPPGSDPRPCRNGAACSRPGCKFQH